MSKIAISVIVSLIMVGPSSKASGTSGDDLLFSSHFYNDVVLGTVAGFIIGLAVGQGSITTFRITSLGFYGGIILGVTTDKGDSQNKIRQSASPDTSQNTPAYLFTFRY